ncbi:TRAP transporter permease [Halobacterium jilantaiense]|uniref:TRAP transporter, 4TM/12TM fusion protein n=1 Tax=Halobacterium jilantaiense TaxID=355548 RepID=A0A1I0NNW6_9EURY|nr:TRAP transporter fused permease subunit [Halobacterium jilantaiense]SEW02586.1 TRAP transporter, 4TM/12TM fusion protein [Halobacterium jilantaiense]
MANDTPDEETPDADAVLQEIERKRSLRGVSVVAVAVIGIAFSVFQMWLAAKGFELSVTVPFYGVFELATLQLLQINAVHVAFALALAFLLYPASTGDGPFARRCVALARGLDDRLGASHPATRGVRRVGSSLEWALVDEDMDRVTPVDVVFVGITALAAAYFVTDFAEIQNMRRFGLDAGRPVQEVFTFLEPVSVLLGPLADTSYALVLGVVGVLLVLEATRRAISLWLMVIVALFIVYARFGHLIPQNAAYVGVLSIPPFDWASIVQNLWYNTENGVFGIPVTVSVQFIYIFILFGAFLEMSGAGQWFIDLAYAATGTRKGGPAKASILASGFMGTISGSSIANTVTTGAFTIPLMKRSGYRPEFAGAVEASASSGGQILPPVMGAAAFLIVQYTGTPFADVIVAAAVPAVVFFFGVWVMVHFEASKEGIGGLDASELVDVRRHLVAGWFYLVPIGLLLYYLIVERLSVARSAWFTLVAIGALMALIAAYGDETRGLLATALAALVGGTFLTEWLAGGSIVETLTGAAAGGGSVDAALAATLGDLGWLLVASGVLTMALRPRAPTSLLNFDDAVDDATAEVAAAVGRPSLTQHNLFDYGIFTLKSMEDGARTAVPVVVAVAAAGIIPGVISISGLGPNLVALIRSVAGGSLVLVLGITAVSSIILGMGMPTTVTYIILSVLLAPVLTPFGIPELAAHLYILYFGVIADITPPVAVAAYAASGVAKSEPFETGVEAFSLSLNKAIVPFAFVVTPGIVLLRRNPGDLPVGDQYSVVGVPDLLDLAYSVPEILLPVGGVFLGVVALAATVIGFVYTDVGGTERAAYAASALLLMAPSLAVSTLYDLLGLLGVSAGETTVALDLALRGVGLVLFAGLLVRNRRASRSAAPAPESHESA